MTDDVDLEILLVYLTLAPQVQLPFHNYQVLNNNLLNCSQTLHNLDDFRQVSICEFLWQEFLIQWLYYNRRDRNNS